MSIKYSKGQWQEMQVILDAVLDQAPDRQLEYLKQVCGERLDLLRDIEELLQAEKQSSGFLDHGAIDLLQSISSILDNKETGNNKKNMQDFAARKIASWRLCEELGRGGMGVVYRAQRNDGAYEQEVAIKLLARENNQSFTLERFKREQQLLAMLVHPGIAQLYDGGLTNEGQAYFVMEYVSGLPLNVYCECHQLSINARLKIIVEVADALDYAHKHLIVHRDIKHSNILVNDNGQVKLLDFGIAKLIDEQRVNELTRTGDQVMTPGFAAPEQLQNKGVTVATDVYQLGLVLYELLTGAKPYQHQANSFRELIQLICEGDISPPSQLVSQVASHPEHDLPEGFSAQQLIKQLRGDVDAIVLKMLNSKPEERYTSMAAFKSDVCAYFESRPLAAQNRSLVYNSKKFLKRNWQAVSVATIVALFIVVYLTTITIQSKRIKLALERSLAEQNKSQQVSGMLVNVFKAADPNVSGLDTITAGEILEKGQTRILTELDAAPDVQAHMLTLVGEIYFSQGSYNKSIQILENSLDLQKTAGSVNNVSYANTLTQLGMAYVFIGRTDDAFLLFEESLSVHVLLKHNQQYAPLEHAETLAAYGQLQDELGSYAKALENLQTAINILRSLGKNGHEKLATALNNIAVIQHTKGEFVQANSNMREAIQLQRSVLGETHSYYTVHLVNYAIMLTDMELFAEAESALREALSIQKNLLGEEHAYYFTSLHSLGVLYFKKDQLVDAETVLRKSLEFKKQTLNENSKSIAISYLWLGATLKEQGRFQEAETAFDKMLTIFKSQNENGELLGRGLSELASLVWLQGDLHRAEDFYKQALTLMLPEGIRISITQAAYGHLLLTQGQGEKALPLLRHAYERRVERYPENHSMVAEAQVLLGHALLQTDNSEAGKNLIRAGFETLENLSQPRQGSISLTCCRSSIRDPSLDLDR